MENPHKYDCEDAGNTDNRHVIKQELFDYYIKIEPRVKEEISQIFQSEVEPLATEQEICQPNFTMETTFKEEFSYVTVKEEIIPMDIKTDISEYTVKDEENPIHKQESQPKCQLKREIYDIQPAIKRESVASLEKEPLPMDVTSASDSGSSDETEPQIQAARPGKRRRRQPRVDYSEDVDDLPEGLAILQGAPPGKRRRGQPRVDYSEDVDDLPEGLAVYEGKPGVWSSRFLPKDTEYGPYPHHTSGSDSSSSKTPNWILRLRESFRGSTVNIQAVVKAGQVYYITTQDIRPNTRLNLSKLVTGLPKQKRVKPLAKQIKCLECGKQFTRAGSLKKHEQQQHTEEKNHKCGVCGKCFSRAYLLTHHSNEHKGYFPHTCTECGKGYHMLSQLKVHMQRHNGVKPHKCTDCGKCFTSGHSLKNHRASQHTRDKVHGCHLCEKSFFNNHGLLKHLVTHRQPTSHTCKDCGQQYTGHYTSVKRYHCQDCGRCCPSQGALTIHQLSHTKERHFECKECDKKFMMKSTLDNHMLSHTGEKSFQCHQCGMCFSRNGNLKRHQQTHKKST